MQLDPALQGLSNAQLYPDIGVAAMLRNQWQDVAFRIGSLGDRAIVAPDDEVVVLAAPDPQGMRPSCAVSAFRPMFCSATPPSIDARSQVVIVKVLRGIGDGSLMLAAPCAGLSDVLRVLAAAEDRSIVMFNPRLARHAPHRLPSCNDTPASAGGLDAITTC